MKKIIIFLLALCLLLTGCVTQLAEKTPSVQQTATPTMSAADESSQKTLTFSSVEAVEKLIAILEGDTSLGTLEEGKDERHNITFEADGETYTFDYELMQSAYGNRLKIIGFPRPADGTEFENFSLKLVVPDSWGRLDFDYTATFNFDEGKGYECVYSVTYYTSDSYREEPLLFYPSDGHLGKANEDLSFKRRIKAEINGSKHWFYQSPDTQEDKTYNGKKVDEYTGTTYIKGVRGEIKVVLPADQLFSATEVTNDLNKVILF